MRPFLRTFFRSLTVLLPLLTALYCSTAVEAAQVFDPTYASYDRILKTFVAGGRVDYKALSTDPIALDGYLETASGVSEVRFGKWTESARLAFLINLYNAVTLRLILTHYPVKSIKDIGGFLKGPWKQPVVPLFGKKITLDNLEHDILRKHYEEPRIHMALVCAARGCPPLRSDAYMAEKLSDQLDDQSRHYLSSPAGFRSDPKKGVVYFSSIFKWYGKDFIAKYSPSSGFAGLNRTERAIANFYSQYLSGAEGDFLEAGEYSVKYLEYDWSLNDK